MKFIAKDVLQNYIDNKWISVQKHPELDLYIYNYTQKTQFSKQWDDVTMACRGLILDGQGNIIAQPFGKFFNLEEYLGQGHQLPAGSFEVFDKLDGSLGILYWDNGKPRIATRGSFTSDQAIKATQMLWDKYGHVNFLPQYTYLFEIIYPSNRIVVDYKGEEKLVLLAIIETETGGEVGHEMFALHGMPYVTKYHGINRVTDIQNLMRDNSEGVVIRYFNGLRLKVKWDEYVRLHRLVTGVNAKTIWELLKNKQDFKDLMERVPEEFYDWVKKTKEDLEQQFKDVEFNAKNQHRTDFENRKDAAFYFKTCTYPQIQFALYDKKPYDQIIWKMLRPVAEKPFKTDIDG